MTAHDDYTHHILTQIETREQVSQRSLSRDMGIALGLTNLLIRKLVRNGWVRIVRLKPNRVRYLLTRAGIVEKTRMSRLALQNSMRFYVEARDRIRERFVALSNDLTTETCPTSEIVASKPIVFYGSGELAEIGFICLRGTDLQLVGVIDDQNRGPFFGIPVYDPADLSPSKLKEMPVSCLVVMSFAPSEDIRARLKGLAFPPKRIFWI